MVAQFSTGILAHFSISIYNFYMHSKAGMWHHVGSTMKIVRNTLFVVGGKGEKGRLRTILLVTAIAATQEGGSPSQHHATFAW
ncbi:hypothetical protein, partial [Phocaeicola vulgatus]